MTLNDLEGHSPVAGLFKCNPSNICAAFYTISTDSVLARFLWISRASCYILHCGLKLFIHAIVGVLGAYFPPNDVIYRCSPQKAPPCAKTRRLSNKAWKSVQRFDLGTWSRKKDRTGQKSLKSHKGVIFHPLGRSPHWTDLHQNLHSSCRLQRNHVCKLWTEIVSGYDFTSGRISYFPIYFCMSFTTVQH